MEIVAKFGAAARGFWWALEDEERKLVIGGLVYALWIVAAMVRAQSAAGERERERRALASAIVDELAVRSERS